MSYSAAALNVAEGYLGLKEWPGAKHNPAIIQMFKDIDNGWVTDDETPWCAAFVGSVLGSIGLEGTGKLNARSYMSWGIDVKLTDAVPGDICVFWRESKDSWKGHVAFLVGFRRGKVLVRGGNQGNSVSDKAYPTDRLLAIRRAFVIVPQRTWWQRLWNLPTNTLRQRN